MKKILAIITSIFILCISLSVSTAASDISVFVDNELTVLTDANGNRVYPFIKNGTTYVPLRGVSEILDCDVIWDGNNKTIKIYEKGQYKEEIFRNTDNNIKIYFNSEEIEFKNANGAVVKPFIDNGTTYVPLRGLSETLGCQVEWDSKNFIVYIWDKEVPPGGTPLNNMKPLEVDGIDFYDELEGERLELNGAQYSNAMAAFWSGQSVVFDINGKYEYVTFVAGSTGNFDSDKKITFIVDGKIADVCEIPANIPSKEFRVELNYGLSLKILFNSTHLYEETGMGNVFFH